MQPEYDLTTLSHVQSHALPDSSEQQIRMCMRRSERQERKGTNTTKSQHNIAITDTGDDAVESILFFGSCFTRHRIYNIFMKIS